MLKTKFHHFDIYLCHTNEELASTQAPHDYSSYIMAGPDNSSEVRYRCVSPAEGCRTCPIYNNCSIQFLQYTGRALYNKHINTFKKLT